MRKLKFEQLECRNLMSSVPWLDGLGLVADIYEDGGYKLSSNKLGAEVAILDATRKTLSTSNYTTTRNAIAGNPNDLNGELFYPDGQLAFSVFYHNGGSSASHQQALGTVGRKAIVNFVAIGGSYVGSCAGAWTAKNLGLISGSWGNSGGSGSHTVVLPNDGNPISEFMLEHNQPLTITSVPFYGGPGFLPNRTRDPDAEYVGILQNGSPSWVRGSAFAILKDGENGSGNVAVVPDHPEYGRKEAHTYLTAALLDYGMDGAKITPDTKASINIGDIITMEDRTEKIGTSQYHIYTINIPENTQKVAIALMGLGGNADLYIQHERYAHEYDYLISSTNSGRSNDFITIEYPEPGTYYIGVKGQHSVANGIPYTLYTGTELPVIPDPSVIGQKIVDIAWNEFGKSLSNVGINWTAGNLRSNVPSSSVGYWCSEFVSGVYKEAGVQMYGGYNSSRPWMLTTWMQLIDWFKAEHTYVTKGSSGWATAQLKPGDYLRFRNHSAMVATISDDGNSLTTIEGNVSGKVATRTFINWRSSTILGVGILT